MPHLPLSALQPLRLQLSLDGAEAGAGARRSLEGALSGHAAIEASPSDLPLLSAEPSDVGAMTALLYSSEHASALTAERRAADAAVLEYQKVRGDGAEARFRAGCKSRQQSEGHLGSVQVGIGGGRRFGQVLDTGAAWKRAQRGHAKACRAAAPAQLHRAGMAPLLRSMLHVSPCCLASSN